ncbi:hypothetical protein F2Q69_00012662 [Brassica cretica]|uniref:Uncharacterized protein n=1 Tax=Brassica cretica TaxID=69181 RepID=A0A8S9QNA5_BRACR|nr:hypothetical protein F2Q69_00012662 [Brassica cretica]
MDAGIGAGASLNRELEAGVLPEAWMILPNQFAPYFSISFSNSGNKLCSQVNRSCSFSSGFPWAGHRSNLKEKRSKLQWASTSACRWQVFLVESFPFLGRELGSRERARFQGVSSVPGSELGVPSSGDPERFVIGDPRFAPYFSISSSRGITCALMSTGVAHSQQALLRQDPIPLVLLAWVPLKPKLIMNPGTRVHSRRRVGNEACESMDSSESSLDLTAEIEELRNAAVGEAPPPPGGDRLSPVGPLSVIGVEEVANWRKKFRLPDDVIIRIPGLFDRVSYFELGEISVYEGFFESGFRDQIPSLVAKISKVAFCIHESLSSIGVPHGVLGDILVHLELKRGDKGDHWMSSAWERPHRSDTVKSL